ncbi:UPF0149 family protein [Neiella marina]|uniref:UPF0149 family protein n=1 Tax=Neiella holothuriorum TaxID=2870530 RepID=A0ABS7EK07_9GAMM|nr:UPF0149 family protein [Neiella holothuriorum]MBW8192681.1 UPF0149 family protein [Neiella holothuriorum]
MYQTPSLYQALNEAIEAKSMLTDAAEVHGILVGQLCGGIAQDSDDWLSNLCDLTNNGEAMPEQVQQLVDDLRQVTAKTLLDEELGFRLLLPDDEQPFDLQAEATSQWVQGFLAGFASASPKLDDASDELNECMRDLSEIALLEVPEDGDDENDIALTELQEYVRIAAMMAFAEFGVPPQAPEVSPALH